MVTKMRIALVMVLILTASAVAGAQESVQIQSNFKVGQQVRYAFTAAVDTSVTAVGPSGLSASARRELAATVTVTIVGVEDSGEVRQDVTIDAVSFRTILNGVEEQTNASELVGKKFELTLDSTGRLLKLSFPLPAQRIGLAEILVTMTQWFPAGRTAVGQTWEALGHGPFYSESLSEIAKGGKTVYRLAAVSDGTASIEGATTISQSGASVLTAKDGRTNINVIASGKGNSRFDFDLKAGRIIGGTSESRVEGKLAFIANTREGEKMQPREGSLVETARYSVKTVQ